jgi:hypothetical protein
MFDNYDMWAFNEAEKDAWLESRPVCEHCGHPIQDEGLMNINGYLYHVDCAIETFSAETEDFCR